MATHIEMAQLGEMALRAISRALSQGDKQGFKELWRSQPIIEHIVHADRHISKAADLSISAEQRIEEFEHTIIRCAMALHLLNE